MVRWVEGGGGGGGDYRTKYLTFHIRFFAVHALPLQTSFSCEVKSTLFICSCSFFFTILSTNTQTSLAVVQFMSTPGRRSSFPRNQLSSQIFRLEFSNPCDCACDSDSHQSSVVHNVYVDGLREHLYLYNQLVDRLCMHTKDMV